MVFKKILRASSRRLGYGIFDLRKDQSPGVFLPGHIRAIINSLNINCVIDAGANVGDYALMLRSIGYQGRIVSIEPLPEIFKVLSARAASDSLWNTLNIALGARDETRDLNVFAASDLSSFLVPSANMQLLDNSNITRSQTVTVRQLDSILDELCNGLSEPRVFLKLDTQGSDLEILSGGRKFMRKVLAFQSEISVIPIYEGMPDYLEALKLYHQLGFSPTALCPVSYDQKSRHVLEFDGVFTRRSFPESATASRD